MRNVLVSEICKERPNASALGALNKAVSSLANGISLKGGIRITKENGYIVGRVNGNNKNSNFGNKVSSVKYSKKELNKIVNK